MADNGTIGRVRTMYVKGTSERVKKLGDEVAAVLKKPQGQVTKDELNKALDSTTQLGRADAPLNQVEELNRLSLHQSLIERASAENLMTPQEIMGRKDTMLFGLGAPGGGGGRMPSRGGGTGPMLPRTGSATGQKSTPIQSDGVVVQKPSTPLRQRGKIDRGKQNAHIEGTNENKVRKSDGATKSRNPTEWAEGNKADELTHQAYEKGTPVQGKIYPDGSPQQIKYEFGSPVGKNGETSVTVHIKQNGSYHGVPSGPKNP